MNLWKLLTINRWEVVLHRWALIGKILLMFVVIIAPASALTKDEEAVRKEIMLRAHDILIASGLCEDMNACAKKDLLFFARRRHGASFQVYGVLDAKVVSSLVELFLSYYTKREGRFAIVVKFYSESHPQVMGLKQFYTEPFLEINLEGEGQ